MSGNIKKIIIVVLVVVVLFFGYSYFFAGNSDKTSLKVESSVKGGNAQAGKDFLVALINLQHVNLDIGSSILKDDNFSRLRDMSVSLPDEPQGRPNPFRVIGVDAPVVGTTSSAVGR